IVVNMDHVRCIERRSGAGFALEARDHPGRGREVRVEEFDGDRGAELRVAGDPDGPHSAPRERAFDLGLAADDDPRKDLHTDLPYLLASSHAVAHLLAVMAVACAGSSSPRAHWHTPAPLHFAIPVQSLSGSRPDLVKSQTPLTPPTVFA